MGGNPSIRGCNRRNSYYNNVLLRSEGHVATDMIRGGSTAALDVEFESSDDEAEESDYEEEEEEEVTSNVAVKARKTALGKATQKAAQKAAKTTVDAALKPKKKKKSSSGGLMKYLRVPYIVKACLNPLVFIQMTKGYWMSLITIAYLKEKQEDSSQDLRNALEQKARHGGGK